MTQINTREWFKLGAEAFKKKEYHQAEAYLKKVLDLHDGFADAYNMLGVIYHDRGMLQKAQKCFEQAIKLNPGYVEAALHLAVTYNDLGQYQQGKEVFNRTLSTSKRKPGELDALTKGKIANMYAEIGDVMGTFGIYHRAEAEYRKALEMGPGFVDIRLKLAQCLREQEKYEEALQEFRQIITERSDYLAARIHLGATLYSMGNLNEAVETWQEVLKLDPDNKSCQVYINMVRKEEEYI